MFFVALRSQLTLLCWRRGSATMAHLGGASRKRRLEEEAITRTLTSRRWRDFVLTYSWYRAVKQLLRLTALSPLRTARAPGVASFVDLAAQRIQANALPSLP